MKNLGVVLLSGILVTVLTGGRPSAIPDRQNVGQDPVGYGFALRPGEPLTLNTACRDTVEYVDSYGDRRIRHNARHKTVHERPLSKEKE